MATPTLPARRSSPGASPLSPATGVHPESSSEQARVTVPSLVSAFKEAGRRITAVTAYDYSMARLVDRAGIDLILVGDSAACVVGGHPTTLPITLDQMLYHAACVTRGVKRALVVGDLPFLSYQPSIERAVELAGRMLKEGGVGAVKLEGGVPMTETIRRLSELDIPVMGHVGLTPQSFHRMGGHRRQGSRNQAADVAGSWERVRNDAHAVAEAGAFSVVLEGIPEELAAAITRELPIPTIGIGAGPHCDGQILVSNDLLGFDPDFQPSFVKRYAQLGETIVTALQQYAQEVREQQFPVTRTGQKAVAV